jgi:hypothetical protein
MHFATPPRIRARRHLHCARWSTRGSTRLEKSLVEKWESGDKSPHSIVLDCGDLSPLWHFRLGTKQQ